MKGNTIVETVITCASWQQAQALLDTLFEQHIITSAECIAVQPTARESKALTSTDHIKLIVQSSTTNVKKVTRVVDKSSLKLL